MAGLSLAWQGRPRRYGTGHVRLGWRYLQSSRWHVGKVHKILVSGDHHRWAYDEPDTMRKALVREGVPPRDVFEDHAGFDTWATMVRARGISESATPSS